jgi:nucleoside permease NupC
MSWVSVAQLIDRVLFEVFVIGLSWVSMAQLIGHVLFEVFVIGMSWAVWHNLSTMCCLKFS